MRNWDFEPRQVSQATKQYISLMSRKPVINIKQENPKLFAVVQELDHINQLRCKIGYLHDMVVCYRIIVLSIWRFKSVHYRLMIRIDS